MSQQLSESTLFAGSTLSMINRQNKVQPPPEQPQNVALVCVGESDDVQTREAQRLLPVIKSQKNHKRIHLDTLRNSKF